MKFRTVLVPLTMPVVLAACLGGGGGGGGNSSGQSGPLTLDSTPTAFTAFSDITADSLVEADAASSVNYSATVAGGLVDQGGTYTDQTSALRALYGASVAVPEAVRLTVDLAGGSVVRDFEDAPTAVGAGASASRYIEYEIDDGGGVTDRLQVNDQVNNGFDFMSFGVWEIGIGAASIDIGGAAWGAATPLVGTGAMPSTGTATYTGDLIGYNVLGGATTVYVADSTIDADFDANTVSFSSTNTVDLATGGAAAVFNIAPTAGTITGNGFSGANPQLGGGGTYVGSFGGDFYGPDAAEAGGWFDITDTANADARYFGSFGGVAP